MTISFLGCEGNNSTFGLLIGVAGLGIEKAGGKFGLVSVDGTSIGFDGGTGVTGFTGDLDTGTPLTLGIV